MKQGFNMRVYYRLFGLTVGCSVIAACGIPADTSVRGIDAKDVKFRLMDTSTTSTTTTSTTTTTIAPIPKLSTTTTTTTVALRSTIVVSMYFVVGDGFVSEKRELPEDVTVAELVNLLVEGPGPSPIEPAQSPTDSGQTPIDPRQAQIELRRSRTVVQPEDVLTVELVAGVALVELAPRFLELPVAEQRLMVGQLVLTLTSRPGVGQVRFSSNGQPVDVPRGDGTFGTQELSSDSFREFIEIDPFLTTEPQVVFEGSSTIPVSPVD